MIAVYTIKERTIPSPEVTKSDLTIEFNRVDLFGNKGSFFIVTGLIGEFLLTFAFLQKLKIVRRVSNNLSSRQLVQTF